MLVGEWVKNLGDSLDEYKIIHQTGSRDFATCKRRYLSKYEPYLSCVEYIHNIPESLNWADLVICRAGIGSVVEVAMSGKPAIFVPLPTAADNHQFENAKVLVDQGAAFMIEEKDLDWKKLNDFIRKLQNNPERLQKVMERLWEIDHSMAQQKIFDLLIKEV